MKYYYYCNQFLLCKEKELCIDVYHKQHYGIKCVSNLIQLEPCNDMFKVISDIIARCCDMWNKYINAINFYNAKKMNYGYMIIMSNHYGISRSV